MTESAGCEPELPPLAESSQEVPCLLDQRRWRRCSRIGRLGLASLWLRQLPTRREHELPENSMGTEPTVDCFEVLSLCSPCPASILHLGRAGCRASHDLDG